MTIRITTTRAVLSLCLALAYMALTPATPAAADREHQQIMADLRMLQEQTQQLQALMNDLGEALRAVSSRIEDQTSLERKAFADGKVQMDTMSGDLRVVREKVDETNVRLGSITQELESIKQAIPEPAAFTSAPPNPLATDPTGAATPGTSPVGPVPPPTTVAVTPPSGIQPQRLWQSSYADYAAANYSLAIQGFESYLKYFPKGQQAHEDQVLAQEVGCDRARGEHQRLDRAAFGATSRVAVQSGPALCVVVEASPAVGAASAISLGSTCPGRPALGVSSHTTPFSASGTIASTRRSTRSPSSSRYHTSTASTTSSVSSSTRSDSAASARASRRSWSTSSS